MPDDSSRPAASYSGAAGSPSFPDLRSNEHFKTGLW